MGFTGFTGFRVRSVWLRASGLSGLRVCFGVFLVQGMPHRFRVWG